VVEKITNNLWWKLLSIILAFLIWLIVVNYEDPMTTRIITDISVEKINEEAITSEMKAIEYREGESISVRVRGKRSVVDRMTNRDVYAYADLEKKSITGAIDIQIEVADGVTVLDKMPSVMMVDLENIITVQKEIQYYMEGEPNENYVYLDPVISPNNIEIQGPESKIGLIKSVLVPVNIEGVTRDVTLYSTPQVIDDNNNIIRGLDKNITQVQIQVPIDKVKSIDILTNIGDLAAEGFEIVGLSLSQEQLRVRGDEADVDAINNVTISDIDVSDLTMTTTVSVDLVDLLPSGVFIHNDIQTVELVLQVEPIVEKTIEINSGDITLRSLPENMQFNYIDETSYEVTFRGLQTQLDEVTIDRISPNINVDNLTEGIHDVELNFFVPSNVELVSERPTIAIELSQSVEEELNPDDQ
jgi:YbbR domain-containing protein